MRQKGIVLVLLMLFTSISPWAIDLTVDELEPTEEKEHAVTLTSGWGDSLAGTTLTNDGLDWEVLPQRGVDDWIHTELAGLADGLEDIDVAIAPDQTVKACGYNANNGTLEVFTLSSSGSTTREVVDSSGNVGKGCAIVIDYRGFVRIAYLDVDASALKIVRENDWTPLQDDDWLIRTLVNDVNITTPPEISIYSNGSIAIAYRDADTGGLHLMRFTGSWWRHTLIREAGVAPDFVLNIDVDDILHLSFFDTIYNRVAVISLDGDDSTFSVVDVGEDIGQPIGHHLDATGRAQLVYGIENGTGLRIVRDLTGRDDGRIAPEPYFVLESTNTTGFGTDADATGDYNNDGYSDLIYGEPGASNDTGAVHVHYGSVNGYNTVPDLTLVGSHSGARFGATLAPAGDVNGDGYGDIVVGAPSENNQSGTPTGAVHLFTGFPSGISSSSSWTYYGDTNGGLFGARVEAAGDVDQDGYADLAISELSWVGTDNGKGRVHVLYGNTSQFDRTMTIDGHKDDLIFGWSILGAGDSNGDGFDDLVIGSSDDQTEISGRGSVQVHHGNSSGLETTPSRVWTMSTQWTLFGHTLNSIGDINNDGYPDFSASELFNNSATVWVFQGGPDGFGQNPYTILTGSNEYGYSMHSAGDVNDDGIQDFLIGYTSGNGEFKLQLGTNTTNLHESDSIFSDSGGANQRLGKIISSGGDADRDGMHELLYASSTSTSDGTPGGSIIIIETRDWELTDLPFDFTVNSLDLAVDAQGRTQLLLDTDDGVYHYERANEILSSSDPWGSTSFGVQTSATMTVTDAGQPIIVTSDGNLAFEQRQGGVLLKLQNSIGAGTGIGDIVSKDENRSASIFVSSSNGLVYANQSESGIDTVSLSEVGNNILTSNQIYLFLDSNQTPHIMSLNDTGEVNLAVQNGSSNSWDSSILLEDINQFSATMSSNGSIGIISVDGGLAATHWFEGNGSDWTMTEQTTLHNTSEVTVDYAVQSIAISAIENHLEVVWLANNSKWQYQSIEDNIVSNITLPEHIGELGNPFFTSLGLILPVEENTNGSHLFVPTDLNDIRTVDLECDDYSEIEIVEGEEIWVLCTDDDNHLVFNTFEGTQPITVSSVTVDRKPSASLDANGTWHILYQDTNQYLMNKWIDTDRDFVPDQFDDLPTIGGQWNDQDGDGYGDNPDAPAFDNCHTFAGTSSYGYYGCSDADGDGFANTIDDCADSGKSWHDVRGCDDTDGDGWSDPGVAGDIVGVWNGDRHPTNWMQSIDTDGDGRYDNHGPDCCGDSNSDEFPLDPQQWEDLDGDGWGDNSSAPTGDKCPGFNGNSIYDRGGCLDSDGDGWSDPTTQTSSQYPEGWIYDRNECENNGTHCADLWPWAADDTSSSNICGTRCNEQWADRDGDGYGDNSSIGAWNRDAFPDDATQHSDTDEDGFGDNPQGNNHDDCPIIWGNSTFDRNGCLDSDGDGYSNEDPTWPAHPEGTADALPDDPLQWLDADGDGFGDVQNGDNWDHCPTIPGFINGQPGPGCPLPEGDQDGDGVLDGSDNCSDTPLEEIVDVDAEGCAPSQLDDDGDGVSNANDLCPNTPTGEPLVEENPGCSASQINQDTDEDGVVDIEDACIDEPALEGYDLDSDGCTDDTDGDGVTDNIDECQFTTSGAAVDIFGCIVVGADTDGDGVEDAFDAFPSDETQWQDTDGDGYGDNWEELDWNEFREESGIGQWLVSANDADACPHDFGTSWSANRQLLGLYGCPDTDGDGVPDPTLNWTIENGADYFPNDPTQYGDYDGDGFGDNPNGNNGDFCPNTPGVAGGVGGDGCPAGTDTDGDGLIDIYDDCIEEDATNWDDDNDGCIDDNDNDNVADNIDACLDTPEDDWYLVDENGCTESQLEEDDSSSFMSGTMIYVLIALVTIVGLGLVLLIIVRIRNNAIDWGDEDDLLEDDWQGDDDDDWSPFGDTPTIPARASTPSPAPIQRDAQRGPATRGPPTRSAGPASRGPPTTDFGGSRAGGSPGSRPGGRPTVPTRSTPAVSEEKAPVRRSRKTVTSSVTSEPSKPVRRTRKTTETRAEPTATSEPPKERTRKTRRVKGGGKTTRRKKASQSWDDLFAADEKEDFDNAVAEAKERLIVGDSETTILARLQSSGWTPKQSKHILGHSKN
ncbi:MAG: hypothetical protein VX320_02530 [Candidatus Thermoplasmatota archaeon]|nr:hypothetical protein [Candidatus Thermoplasmatota archaeon]MEE3082951.1 hypothetical protein [Candidatus Thermoplasmatota archaeon]